MLKEDEIQKLVNRAKDGDQSGFGRLYEIFSPRIFSFLVVRVRHHQTTEDLLHTVFLKAWNSLPSYVRGKAKFSTWLFQIANYTLIDHWRTKKETVELSKVDNLSAFSVEPELFEEYGYLWEAMSGLGDDHKTVLTLRFHHDMDISEIAQIMGKTQVAIRVLQHRALKSLRSKLKDQGKL